MTTVDIAMTDPCAADIERFYDTNVTREWERLERHRTEYAVTLRALRDYLPSAPATIADIGGGPGRYALALAQGGYAVTLVDLSSQALAAAQARAREAGLTLADAIYASATDLAMLPDGRYDAVLLLGPLYHLLADEGRRQAVREAHRILRDDGILFASFITRYAVVRWAAKHRPTWIVDEQDWHNMILASGVQYLSSPDAGFTHAYFAHPAEVRPLMEASGLATLDLVACEGVISMIDEQLNTLTGAVWEAWVDLNYRLGKDPSVHGAAEHLLYVGRKAGATAHHGKPA
jgi:SAM-dependent methyltransferase